MSVVIIHLSDLHAREGSTQLLQRFEQIVATCTNFAREATRLVLLITGDIAYSGKSSEFGVAAALINKLRGVLGQLCAEDVTVICVPGNHDCDLPENGQGARKRILATLQSGDLENLDDDTIKLCCSVQDEYQRFQEQFTTGIVTTNPLGHVVEVTCENHTVAFACLNSAWMSERNEKHGFVYFPMGVLEDLISASDADMVLAALHHPLPWYRNHRELRKGLSNAVQVAFTGHEHDPGAYTTTEIRDNHSTVFVEGAALFNPSDPNESGFNVFVLDVVNLRFQLQRYRWSDGKYVQEAETNDWAVLSEARNKVNLWYSVNERFRKTLGDPGASFTHPRKAHLTMNDIFVYPRLREVILEAEKTSDLFADAVSSEDVISRQGFPGKFLVTGEENTGKTTLCHAIFKHCYDCGHIPVIIDGRKVNSTDIRTFSKTVNRAYEHQYDSQTTAEFEQTDNARKVLIIDDFNLSPLAAKYKSVLIQRIGSVYPNVVITGGDTLQMEEFLHARPGIDTFEGFSRFRILDFGHVMRSDLITRWLEIERDECTTDESLLRRHDLMKRTLDLVIGKNLVPSRPIFLLAIIQAVEAQTPYDMQSSSYGYYYQMLITQSLHRMGKLEQETETVFNYAAELAYAMLQKSRSYLSEQELREFHDRYCKEYDIRIEYRGMLSALTGSDVLALVGGECKFQYRYMFYFFTAKYISDHLPENEMRRLVDQMTKRLHVESFANILMFLTYHSGRDPFVLEAIERQARAVFEKVAPLKLDTDVQGLNALMDKVPKALLEPTSVRNARQRQLEASDEAEEADDVEENPVDTDLDLSAPIPLLDWLGELNKSIKVIEILGQLLTNFAGSLKAEPKLRLCQEAYLAGLRALASVLQLLNESLEAIIDIVDKLLADHAVASDEDRVKLSRRIVFNIVALICHGLIKRIASPVGSQALAPTLEQVKNKLNTNAASLIDIAVKLEFAETIPFQDIKDFYDRLAVDVESKPVEISATKRQAGIAESRQVSNNPLATAVLQRLVVQRLYMFPTDWRDKQRLCRKLGISMETQRQIDVRAGERRRE